MNSLNFGYGVIAVGAKVDVKPMAQIHSRKFHACSIKSMEGYEMKIGFYPQILNIANRVKERDGDKQEGAAGNAYDNPKQDSSKNDTPPETVEIQVSDLAVQQAIEALNHDEMAMNRGLHAESDAANGQAGLRVVLKDSAGGILRNVSGEEFLKLREAIAGGKRPGKIIDRKA